MKSWKLTDVLIQVLLIIFFTVLLAKRFSDNLLYAYFITGGYQLFSCLVHIVFRVNQQKGAPRFIYHRILIGLIILGLLTIPVMIFFLYFLLFAAPFIAVFYTIFSISETIKIIQYEK